MRAQAVAPPAKALEWFPIADQRAWSADARHDPEAFWMARAAKMEWQRAPSRAVEGALGSARWFPGGRLNVTVSCLDRHARSHPDSIAYESTDESGATRTIAYGALLEATCRLANALARDGVAAGDRVVISMPLLIEGIVAMLACARLGAIHCVVYAGIGPQGLRDRLEDCGASVLLAAARTRRRGKPIELGAIVENAVRNLPSLRRIVMLSDDAGPKTSAGDERVRDWNEYQEGCESERAPAILSADDPLFILHTSGTTGRPKGIVHAHGYLAGAAAVFADITGLTPSDVLWCTSDLGWMTGHTQIVYGALANRYHCVIRDGAPDAPSAGAPYETIERFGVTQIYTAPTFARMLLRNGAEHALGHDLSSLRAIYCGGEPLNPPAWRFLFETLGRGTVAVCQHWGQTETGAPSIGFLPTTPVRPERTGIGFGPMQFDVVDEGGATVAPDEPGLLVARAPWPHLFTGIWSDEAAYRRCFERIPGAYFTGDAATIDEDGWISVIGRADDVINVAGHRIGPAEVESALLSHPACDEAAVVGVPDEVKGMRAKAFVVVAAGWEAAPTTAAALLAHARATIGAIAAPAEIEFVDRIPKTRSGKILRRIFSARESDLDPGDLTSLEE